MLLRCGPSGSITTQHVFVYDALKTPQFWLIWWILCLNVTAGIGVLGQASAMSQEMFRGRITAVAASGLVGLFSLFNMGGRFVWSSISDYIGRKNTYFVFFALGTLLYALVPYAGAIGSVALFVLCYMLIFSMYGGGFATVPAYLRDMFGTRYVGAIHGLLLTAWSMAGIFGPVLVNYIREYNITHGVAKAQAYNVTMYRDGGAAGRSALSATSLSNPCTSGFTCARSKQTPRSKAHRYSGGNDGRYSAKRRRRQRRQARPRLGLRRDPAGVGCGSDPGQRGQGVSLSSSNAAAAARSSGRLALKNGSIGWLANATFARR